MKIKNIIGVIFMILLTISGSILLFGISIKSLLSSKAIMNVMAKTNYIEKTEQQAKDVLGHYMELEQVEEMFKVVCAKEDIKEIANAFDSNTVEQAANGVKQTMEQTVLDSLDENISQDAKKKFSTVVSDAYMKTIFPVTEFKILSGIYAIYGAKLNLILIVAFLVILGICIYLVTDKESHGWIIIAMYNITLLSIMFIIALNGLNGITIGNERTTLVIRMMLNKIKIEVIISTVIMFIISCFLNYIVYLKKVRNKK